MKEDRRERLPPSKQNCRGERSIKKKQPATRAVRGQMTSCIAASLLSRSAVPRWGGGGWRGWRGSFPLSVCTFFFPSGGSSHGRTGSDLCLGRATSSSSSSSRFSLFLSAGMDTGSSRDVTPRERGGARL